ncbi:MAG: DUF92 domain-containing protein [Acidobacteriota bacterium]
MSLTAGEIARKTVHMAVGGFAFLLRFLGPLWGAVLALTAFLFNWKVLPRLGGRHLLREGEKARGQSIGVLLYPICVLLLILLFHRRLEVAAATWAILAFGDGMASIVGMALGRAKLPWNAAKSWAGTFAFWLFGTAGATVLLQWTAPGRYELSFALAVAAVTALVAALLESLPQGLDDNLGVPLVSGLLLFCLVLGVEQWPLLPTPEMVQWFLWGAVINAVLAVLAYGARSVNLSGALAGWLIGTTLYGFLGWRGFLLLLAFFVIGTACTKLGYQRKAKKKLAQEGGGRRGARHALANTSVAVACAVFAVATPYPLLFTLAFAGAFATAAADTAGSEIGQLLGKRTFLITNLRPVPAGTEGAVSVEGTVASILASAVIAALGAGLGLFPWWGVAVVVVAAFIGTTLESLVGATLEKRGLLDNEAVNFLNTLVGALAAAGLAALIA